jgi:hypothetical protein
VSFSIRLHEPAESLLPHAVLDEVVGHLWHMILSL